MSRQRERERLEAENKVVYRDRWGNIFRCIRRDWGWERINLPPTPAVAPRETEETPE